MNLEPNGNSIKPADPADPAVWTNRRILVLTTLVSLIVMAVWRMPEAIGFMGRRTGELVFVMVTAASLTYLLRPSARWLAQTVFKSSQPRAARTWAAGVVFIGTILLIYCFIAIALKPVTGDVKELWNNFAAQTPLERQELLAKWQAVINHALEPYEQWLPEGTSFSIDKEVPRAITSIAPRAREWATHALTHASFLVELLLLPVLVFYFLCDGPAIRDEASLLIPPKWHDRADRLANDFDRVFGGYIRGQVWMCIIAWGVVTVMLLVLHVPHAATLGIIAGITRAVPVIGPLLGAIPLVLVCLLTTGSVPITVALLFGFLLMHFVESKVLLPKIIGHEVDLHPVSVIVVLLLGLEFFGFLGVFLAVPFAAVLKILLIEWQLTALNRASAEEAAEAAATESVLREEPATL